MRAARGNSSSGAAAAASGAKPASLPPNIDVSGKLECLSVTASTAVRVKGQPPHLATTSSRLLP
jgi:hypothetical protein